MAEPDDIYDFVSQLGSPSKLPGPWRVITCNPSFFDLEGEPATLLQRLQAEFDPDDLIQARVAVVDDKNNVSLSPSLAKDRRFIAAVRRAADQKPIDLLTGTGSSLAGRPPWNVALFDFHVQEMLKSFRRQLCIVTTPQDSAVLMSLGFPATTASGLKTLKRERLEHFGKRLRLREQKYVPVDEEYATGRQYANNYHGGESIALVLANWSPSQLDLADVPPILESRDHLRAVERHCRIALDNFTVWKPTPEHVERFRFCLANGTRSHIDQALLESLEESCESLEDSAIGHEPEPRTFAEAFSVWNRCPNVPGFELLKARRWSQVQQFLQRDLIDQFMAEAQGTADPVRRNQLVELAGLNSTLHPLMLRLATAAAQCVSAQGPAAPPPLPKEELKQLLALTDRIHVLSKDLQSCPTTRKRKLTVQTKVKPTKASSQSLDSGRRKPPR